MDYPVYLIFRRHVRSFRPREPPISAAKSIEEPFRIGTKLHHVDAGNAEHGFITYSPKTIYLPKDLEERLVSLINRLKDASSRRVYDLRDYKTGKLIRQTIPNLSSIIANVDLFVDYLYNRTLKRCADFLPKLLVTRDRTGALHPHMHSFGIKPHETNRLQKAFATENKTKDQTEYHNVAASYGNAEGISFILSGLFHGNYGSTQLCLGQISSRYPWFAPKCVLDFGSGTGANLWCMESYYARGPSAQSGIEYTCVEPSMEMRNISDFLTQERLAVRPKFRTILDADSERTWNTYDMVISSYTLSEITDSLHREHLIMNLWNKTKHFLVLVENGSPEGFLNIMEARSLILNNYSQLEAYVPWSQDHFSENLNDAMMHQPPPPPPRTKTPFPTIIGPCTHTKTCPLLRPHFDVLIQKGDNRPPSTPHQGHPCAFSANVHIPPSLTFSKRIKAKSFKTAKYTYLVLMKEPPRDPKTQRPFTMQHANDTHGRVVFPPLKRDGHVIVDVCHSNTDTHDTDPESLFGKIERNILSDYQLKNNRKYSNVQHRYSDLKNLRSNDLFPTHSFSYKDHLPHQ